MKLVCMHCYWTIFDIFVQWKIKNRSYTQYDHIYIYNGYIRIIIYPQTTSGATNKELLTMTITEEDWKSKVRVRMTFHCINFALLEFLSYIHIAFQFLKMDRNEKQTNQPIFIEYTTKSTSLY